MYRRISRFGDGLVVLHLAIEELANNCICVASRGGSENMCLDVAESFLEANAFIKLWWVVGVAGTRCGWWRGGIFFSWTEELQLKSITYTV